jgi:regulator of protease activity HflC (stomatin/prohibitin superfamily)
LIVRPFCFRIRPERILTAVTTTDFVGNWTTRQDSFAVDVPNDALIVEDTQTGQLETAIVIQSFSPVYDKATNSRTYTIVAENATSVDLPSEFGQSNLVIDITSKDGSLLV